MEDNFLAKILKVRTMQYAYLTTCIFKMILQYQPEAPDGLDQDVPSLPDHDYCSCRAGIPAPQVTAQGKSSINTNKVLHVLLRVFSSQLCHLSP